MPIVRVYIRQVDFQDWPGVQSLPVIDFNPIDDADTGKVVAFGSITATLGKCYPTDLSIPDDLAFVEELGYKYVRTPDGKTLSANDLVMAMARGEPGYHLIRSEKK
jgi:hypothetical protein